MRIREALPVDVAAVTRLRVQAELTHARLLPDYFRAPDQTVAVSGGDAGPTVLVAVTGDDVVGYVALRIVDTPRDPTVTSRRRAHVETVAVDEARRRRGVGTALMRSASDWARQQGAAELVLTVWADNRAASALYRSLGYEPIARILRRPID